MQHQNNPGLVEDVNYRVKRRIDGIRKIVRIIVILQLISPNRRKNKNNCEYNYLLGTGFLVEIRSVQITMRFALNK